MAYRNKIYVCFDAVHDAESYLEMKAWREHERAAFNVHNAHEINELKDADSPDTNRRMLRERLAGTAILIVLIGADPKSLYKYVRWEIEYAVEHELPIIALNLNDARRLDTELCPAILKERLALHIPFGQEVLEFALSDWPALHASLMKQGESGDYYYRNHVYRKLGF